MTGKNELLERIEDRYDKMSKGQKRLADYIRASYEKAVFMTASRLGEVVGVSHQLADPKCKEAFVLSRLNGLKNREIAEHMAITEKVVEKHITRALKRFRDGLRRYALLLGTLLSLWKW